MKNEKIIGSITIKQGLIIFASIVLIGLVLFGIILLTLLFPISAKTIDGEWETSETSYMYKFEPQLKIYELEITFSLKDANNNELTKIVKTVGDVKVGQEYTVIINFSELDEYANSVDIKNTIISISNGKRKLT